MNDKIEEKKRLNKAFEIFDTTFEKNGLQVIGKGIDITSLNWVKVYIEVLVNDKTKIKDDFRIIVNMYDSDDCIEFHNEEYVESEYLEDLYTAEISFSDVEFKNLKTINKIRIYLVKAY